jgi:hypothetical protein
MKTLKLFLLLFALIITSCTPTKFVNKQRIISILPRDASKWTLEECNKIIDFYSVTNSGSQLFNTAPLNLKVFIRALPLNKTVIKAIARKEVIEKRLNEDEYFPLLEDLLKEYTSLTYDPKRKSIVESDSNYTKGYSFKLYFENKSDPFEPIFLEDGYSYFFLENMDGNFSRVIEVMGLYAEDYIQLDGYLNVIVTFSPFAADGKRLFDSKDLNEGYRLVFNGLQSEPIVIEWNTN